jgi:plastocyanin
MTLRHVGDATSTGIGRSHWEAIDDMLGRLRATIGLRPTVAIGAAFLATIALIAPSLVLAANPAVTITESGQRYHFTPGTISIQVGQTVTWTDSTDAPHTVTSDQAGGPMQSSLINQGGTYHVTFTSAGDFAYHCDVHPYMHGTVHVEAAAAHPTPPPAGSTPLPPTDASAGAPSLPLSRRSALLAMVAIGTFVVVLFFGSRLRRRAS